MSFFKRFFNWDWDVKQKEVTTRSTSPKQDSYLTPHGNKLPPYIHQELNLDWLPEDGRLIVVGDVHGCYIQLKELLEDVRYAPKKDCLIFVGDLVNKGPASCEIIDFALKHGALAVLGNHDDAALNAYNELIRNNTSPNNFPWVAEMSQVQAGYLASLPFSLSIPELKIIIVHAGLVPGVSLEKQNLTDLYKMRYLRRKWTTIEALEVWDEECLQWADVWNGPQHVIFGHDAVRGLQTKKYATGLDAGCVYGGRLAACLIPAGKLLQMKREGQKAATKSQSKNSFDPTANNLEIEIITVAGRSIDS